jgi:hypothetical protein
VVPGFGYESGTRRRVSSLREEAASFVLPYSEGQIIFGRGKWTRKTNQFDHRAAAIQAHRPSSIDENVLPFSKGQVIFGNA